jgi:hypothetical protein
MKLSPAQYAEINSEVIERLKEFIKCIKEDGIEAIGLDFDNIDAEDLSDKANDAFAGGDILGAVVLIAMDDMDAFGDTDA